MSEYSIHSIDVAKAINTEMHQLARYCAQHNLSGGFGTLLPDGTSHRVIVRIENDNAYFMRLVREYQSKQEATA